MNPITTGYIVLMILASLFVLLAFLPRVIRSFFRTLDRILGVNTETIDKHGKRRPPLIARWKKFLDAKAEEEE